MAVTELALLRLHSQASITDPSFLANLTEAKRAMRESSGFNFHYYICLEDPCLIFVIGAWPSVDYHMNTFIPGPENQRLLQLLVPHISVGEMFHLDSDRTKTPFNRVLEMPVLALGRYSVETAEQQQSFQDCFEKNRRYLHDFIGGKEKAIGGWRIDKDSSKKDKAEFILFSAWESVDAHMAFARSEGSPQFAQLTKFVSGADIKHAKLLDVETWRAPQ